MKSLDSPDQLSVKVCPITRSSSKLALLRELSFSFADSPQQDYRFVIARDWFFHSYPGSCVAMVFELCELDLERFLMLGTSGLNPRISPCECYRVLCDLTHALVVLESYSVVHRDLKPANILWKRTTEGGIWKLGDFGSCQMSRCENIHGSTHRAFIGTVHTASPEALACQSLTPKSDIWSLGCNVWEVVVLRRPFRAADLLAYQNNCFKPGHFPIDRMICKPSLACNSHDKKSIMKIVRRFMLVPRVDQRFSASQLAQLIQSIRVPIVTDGLTAMSVCK